MKDISKYLLLVYVLAAGCDVAEIGNTSKENNSITDSQNISNVEINEADEEVVLEQGENPVCDSVMSVDEMGSGIRWKVESAADGNLVILFPAEFVNRFVSVSVPRAEDGELEEGVFSDFTNGKRQTWRFSMPGGEYEPQVIADDTTQVCEWIFPDSSVDWD